MSFVHLGYRCNGCKVEPIVGRRWHCYVCKRAGRDFNICEFCHKKFSHPHALGAIKRHTEKGKEVHRPREKDKREGHIVDPNKYDFTPDKLNRRFASKIMEEPLDSPKRGGRSKHARTQPPKEDDEFSFEGDDYFADLI